MSELVQLRLLGEEERTTQDVPLATILKQPSLHAAYNLCINVSGKADQAFCIATGIDPGNWSAMRRGTKHFPTNTLDQIMIEAGNTIPLTWQNYRHGFDVPKKRMDSHELEIAALKLKLAEAEKDKARLIDLWKQVSK